MISATIQNYNDTAGADSKALCIVLAKIIDAQLTKAENKVWHGHPVWFLDGNPVVGYAVRKDNVQLLFWSGQSFDEPGLKPEGSFKAAEARLHSVDDISESDLKRWLQKSVDIQWDYKNIVKRKGKLERLK
jgi:hypothetical protein